MVVGTITQKKTRLTLDNEIPLNEYSGGLELKVNFSDNTFDGFALSWFYGIDNFEKTGSLEYDSKTKIVTLSHECLENAGILYIGIVGHRLENSKHISISTCPLAFYVKSTLNPQTQEIELIPKWQKVITDFVKQLTTEVGLRGNGIKNVKVEYQKSIDCVNHPNDWLTAPPKLNNEDYLWTKVTLEYTDPMTSTEFYSVGGKGNEGPKGDQGNPGFSPTLESHVVADGVEVSITDTEGIKKFKLLNGYIANIDSLFNEVKKGLAAGKCIVDSTSNIIILNGSNTMTFNVVDFLKQLRIVLNGISFYDSVESVNAKNSLLTMLADVEKL